MSNAGGPPPRGGHSTTIVAHYAVVFGGSTDRTALNDTWALDLGTCRLGRLRAVVNEAVFFSFAAPAGPSARCV